MDRAMTVLHVYKTYLPEDFTGIPRVIHALAEGMNRSEVESHVFALGPEATVAPLPVGQHHLHLARRDLSVASAGLSLSAFPKFARLAKAADLIHYHFPWPMADLLHVTLGGGKPSLVTYHSDIVRQRRLLRLYAPLRDRFLGSVDAIVATSPNYMATSPVLQKFAGKTTSVPIGLPEDDSADPALVAAWRERLGEGFFLFLGALRYYKGLPFLMEASHQTAARIVVAGQGDSAEWAQQGGDNVAFIGPVTDADKTALLSLCRAFVFPSHLRSEAFGIALLEAARASRAMICCEIGSGTTYINRDGETGLVAKPEDSASLARAISTLDADPPLAAEMGRKARQRYETLFRAQDMVDGYMRLYRELVRSG